MDFQRFTVILDRSPIIQADEVLGQPESASSAQGETGSQVGTSAPAPAPDPAQAPGGGSLLLMVGAYAVIFGALWFFMIRPQRKREKEAREMQSSIRPGDNVVTSSGFFGKVMDVGEDAFVVEFGTNRGIRIPVRRSDIVGIKEPKLTPPPVTTAKE